MAIVAFTAHHSDRSNNTGYQFEFHCDRCRTGFMSSFQASKLGMAEGFLRAAGGLFGGTVGKIAYAGDSLKEAMRGPARDAAFRKAVEEGKQHFKQCTGCGKWVCPQQCWNAQRTQCKTCAPDVQAEIAAAQAGAAKEQALQKARQGEPAAKCPHCGAACTVGKFCPECGKATQPARTACPKCSAKVEAGAKFCPECGDKLV